MQNLQYKTLAGKFEYPGLYLRYGKDVFYFDCGEGKFPQRDAQKTRAAFFSHLHLDHTFGFERLINNRLGRTRRLPVFGPDETAARIWSRIKGHTWNLLPDNGLNLALTELKDGYQSTSLVSVPGGLDFPVHRCFTKYDGTAFSGQGFKINYTILDHATSSAAYAFLENDSLVIDKAGLKEKNLKGGPWIKELKKKYLNDPCATLRYDGKDVPVKHFADILHKKKGRKIVYAVDFGYTEDNIRKMLSLAVGADVLFCEAHFPEEDIDRAKRTFHLTAGQAGKLAQKAEVKSLCLFHFSYKYKGEETRFFEEAGKYFSGDIF